MFFCKSLPGLSRRQGGGSTGGGGLNYGKKKPPLNRKTVFYILLRIGGLQPP